MAPIGAGGPEARRTALLSRQGSGAMEGALGVLPVTEAGGEFGRAEVTTLNGLLDELLAQRATFDERGQLVMQNLAEVRQHVAVCPGALS